MAVKSRTILLLSAFLLLTSCASEPFQKEIEAVFAIEKETSYAEGHRIPWAVGQWALFRTTRSRGETLFRLASVESRGFRRLAITRQEGAAFWVEIHEVDSDEERRIALLVDNVHTDRLEDLRLLQLKIRQPDGEVVTVTDAESRPSVARDVWDRFQTFTASMDLVGSTGRIRRVTVPAGTFEETYVVPVGMSLGGSVRAGHLWFTNTVPIVYFAQYFERTVSWIWGETTVRHELVDFGLEGAESAFFDVGGGEGA